MFTDYPKEIILKDGTGVTLRPLRREDKSPLLQMYEDLSEDDRWFICGKAFDEGTIEQWITREVFSLGAFLEGRIIAHGVLGRDGEGCRAHIGKVRVSVVPAFRGKNLGTWVLFDLMNQAIFQGVEILVMDLVEDLDSAVIRGARRLDFFQQTLLRDYLKDAQGNYHNLVIMMKRLYLGWEYNGGLSFTNPAIRP